MNYTEKNKLLDKIAVIGLMAIFVEIFLYAIDRCFTGEISDWLLKMPMVLNTIGGIFLLISIVLYVIAFKKANEKPNSSKALYATEFLVLALICPFLTYWYTRSTAPLNTIDPKNLWWVVLAYYVIRVIYTCVKAYLGSSSRQLKKKKN